MFNKLSHFAIYIDDIKRASDFYKSVFNWSFENYGSEDFSQIKSNDSEGTQPIGALQHRKYSPIPDKVIGFECSIAIENVEKVLESVKDAGGTIVMPKTEVPNVGWLIKFLDTEGNLVCAMQYHEHILQYMK